ncbi:MAG: hypothetical protein C0617_08875 [Desulfuromonas sp.]|nr:MAG: hypothetical protein C0617_08875 [Desulfuromonas sp.]
MQNRAELLEPPAARPQTKPPRNALEELSGGWGEERRFVPQTEGPKREALLKKRRRAQARA